MNSDELKRLQKHEEEHGYKFKGKDKRRFVSVEQDLGYIRGERT